MDISDMHMNNHSAIFLEYIQMIITPEKHLFLKLYLSHDLLIEEREKKRIENIFKYYFMA